MFVFCWSLISPLCLGIVVGSLSLSQKNWHIADENIGLSIVVYVGYWLLLAMLQAAALFWRFQDRKFAIQWLQITAIIGSLVMITHDLWLVFPDGPPSGQGRVILLLSLPCLAVIGSLLLGAAQFRIVRSHYRDPTTAQNRDPIWFVVSFMSGIIGFGGIYISFIFISWIIGFGGIFINFSNISIAPLFIMAGTALKGWFIDKYLA